MGKIVCDLLDKKFIKFVGLEINPQKAIEARNRGLPVFFGDITRPEVAQAFNVGAATRVVLTVKKTSEVNKAVIVLRRLYPDLDIFARATNAEHQKRLQNVLDVKAMVPVLPQDSALLSLPFGGAVLKSLGTPEEEVNAIMEAKRKEVLSSIGLKEAADLEEDVQSGAVVESDGEDVVKIVQEEENVKEEVDEDVPFLGEFRAVGEDGGPVTKKDFVEGVLYDFANAGTIYEGSGGEEETNGGSGGEEGVGGGRN